MKDTERCRKCRYKYDDRVCRFCLDFNKYNPMTNSMKIRSMNDEELAEFFVNFTTICEMSIHYDENCMIMTDERCKEGILQWLKSEAKE